MVPQRQRGGERRLRITHWVVKLVSAWGVHTCVREPMLNTCVGTYMLCVIYMCCAACEFVCGYACVFWICICVACLYAQKLYVCFLRGSMHFLFLIPLVHQAAATLTFQGCGGYPACTFFSHLPSAQKMIDDPLPFCKQLSPPGPIVRRPRLGDIRKHHADRQAASLCSSPLSMLSSVG